jgi:hypothetical protein
MKPSKALKIIKHEVKLRVYWEYYLSIKFDDKATDADRDQFNENAKKVFEAMLDVPHSRKLLQRAIDSSNKVHIEIVKEEFPTDKDDPKKVDAPLGLTYEPKNENGIWNIKILEKNIETTRNEIIYGLKKAGDKISIGGKMISITPKRYTVLSKFNLINIRGIVGSHEIGHFLSENKAGERKANRAHRAVARQKIRKQNRNNNPTRYKNPRFL